MTNHENHELILKTLHCTSFTAQLRDWEIEELAKAVTVHEYKAGTYLIQPGNTVAQDSLLILATGEAEVKATVNDENMSLSLLKPGDLAGIVTFVGGNLSQISAHVIVKTDSKVLFLERARFESLLKTQPAIVYYVMKGIVCHLHGLVRRMNEQSVEMTSYIHHA